MRKIMIMGLLMCLLLLVGCNPKNATFCEGPVEEGGDLYYYKYYPSNVSNSGWKCKTYNKTLGDLQHKERERISEIETQKTLERKACYEEGEDHNVSFDLRKDYNLTCDRIKYINDHFLKNHEQVGAGSIEGYYSGFFSRGSISGEFYQWIEHEVLATGNLPKTATFHLDCENSTLYWKERTICDNGKIFPDEVSSCWNGRPIRDTKKFIYYTEADFIMYYANNCIDNILEGSD